MTRRLTELLAGLRPSLLACTAAILSLLAGEPAAAHSEGLPPAARVRALAQGDGITNPRCPVLTDEDVDPEIFSEYRGKRVFLCCRKCLKKFQASPEAYVANLPAGIFSGQADRTAADHENHQGEDPAHSEHAALTQGEPRQEHDHSQQGSMDGGGLPFWIAWVGRFHPMVVHFPIALIMAAALAEALTLLTATARFAFVARFLLWLGAIGAVVAAALGWADATGVGQSYSGFSAQLLSYHRWLGTTTAALAVCALLACERAHLASSRGRMLGYRVLVLLCIVSVAVTGHLGAALIYGWDYLSK